MYVKWAVIPILIKDDYKFAFSIIATIPDMLTLEDVNFSKS